MELRTGTVLVAADVRHEGREGRVYRRLTVVDQESGNTAELDVDSRVNGELDNLLHKTAVLRTRYSRRWPREDAEGPRRPITRLEVVGGFIVDAAA